MYSFSCNNDRDHVVMVFFVFIISNCFFLLTEYTGPVVVFCSVLMATPNAVSVTVAIEICVHNSYRIMALARCECQLEAIFVS